MILSWTAEASRNLEELGTHIAQFDNAAAFRATSRIIDAVDNLRLFPEMGRMGRHAGTRELFMPKTRYIVAYRVVRKACEVLAIYHASREWPQSF